MPIENVSKEGKDLLSFKDLKELIQVKELESLTEEKEESYHGQKVISFWFIENDFDGMEFDENTNVRCRTRGGKCYLGMLSKLNCLLLSFKGELFIDKGGARNFPMGG